MSKIIIAIIVVIIVGVLGYWVYQTTLIFKETKEEAVEELTEEEQICIDAGGKIVTSLCCKNTTDFPNLCLTGPCGCSPANSQAVKICDCGEGKCFDGNVCAPLVRTFYQCFEAGYVVMESYPGQCETPDGRIFVEGEERCLGPVGETMSLFEAKEIALESECGDRLKEPYLKFSICNIATGTWWIDLDIEKEGCNPACLVNVATKEASINWRCRE